MTNEEVEHLNQILPEIPIEEGFRISDLIRSLFNDPEYFLYPGDVEPEVRRSSDEITSFLVDKGFATYHGDFFWDNIGNNDYESRRIVISEAGKNLKNLGSYQKYTTGIQQEPDLLIRLDWVLHFMVINGVQGIGIESAWREIKKLHPSIHLEYNESYRQQMFDKLVAEKYLAIDNRGIYTATLNGAIFDSKGGYKGEERLLNQENNWRLYIESQGVDNGKKLNLLTLILGVGTLGLFLFEIYKIILEQLKENDPSFYNRVFPFALTVEIASLFTVTIIGVYYLLKSDLKKK